MLTYHYIPRFQVTQADYDAASPQERDRYKYIVVKDEPIPLPLLGCCMAKTGRENAENRIDSRPLNEFK